MSAVQTLYTPLNAAHTGSHAKTNSLFLRIVDRPAANDSEQDPDAEPRVRAFDRFRLFTHRLAFFRMQTRPIAGNGQPVSA